MEYETIKMIARSTEILCHFTQMYNQSIHLLQSIPNEEMNKGLASDSSSTFTNIFKANSIKYIKIVIGFLFLFTFILILIEF